MTKQEKICSMTINKYKLKQTGEIVDVKLLYDLKGNVFYYSYKCKSWEESGGVEAFANFNKENELQQY